MITNTTTPTDTETTDGGSDRHLAGLRVRTAVKGGTGPTIAGGSIRLNHSGSKGLKVRTAVKGGTGPSTSGGSIRLNHSGSKGLRVRFSVSD